MPLVPCYSSYVKSRLSPRLIASACQLAGPGSGSLLPKLTIPSQHHAGISKLLAWDSATFDQFLAALESQPSSVSLLLPVSSSINVPNINREDGAAVFSAVAALHLVRAAADIELDQFVRD